MRDWHRAQPALRGVEPECHRRAERAGEEVATSEDDRLGRRGRPRGVHHRDIRVTARPTPSLKPGWLASQAEWGSDNQVRAGEPLLLLGQAQPQVDRYRRRAAQQARVERDHEVFARRYRDCDALRALELPRSSQRGIAQLGVGQATLEPLDRNAVGVLGGGGVDPVAHDQHGSLARVPTTWKPAGEYTDIRYETATGEDAGIAKITINRPD